MSRVRKETAPLSKIRNTTFAEDIENLALNASLSTLSDPSLCTIMNVTATSVKSITVSVYRPRNLFIAYGISIFVSTLSVIAGAYAMYVNGFVYDASPTTLGLALRRDDVREVLEQMSSRSKKLRVRFDPDKGFLLKRHDHGVNSEK
ncbi:hypothetical protein CC86DRAFT_377957 [Ophiobolus disseminans]|uniref:Uncharacterized protein n=1 Tax=Ophiobolus disseminans TaxID=1469910 RepID=A0A6A7AEC1_9PLEO|nr:hypothetical protein CC86DRAFT_377957 [Ophiobolus disseminans]